MVEFYDFPKKKVRRIDPTKPFPVKLDMTGYVSKSDAQFVCTKCHQVLVTIEPGGILGEDLNQIDTAVILDHHLSKHDPMRPINLNPDTTFGP